jgi:hypothetical protein
MTPTVVPTAVTPAGPTAIPTTVLPAPSVPVHYNPQQPEGLMGPAGVLSPSSAKPVGTLAPNS